MVKKKLEVVIDNAAKRQLQEAYHYIKEDSVKSAEKVRSKILASIKEPARRPKHHPADKYRSNRNSAYRAYELYKYRITYHVSETQVTVIRIRHTRMNPLQY